MENLINEFVGRLVGPLFDPEKRIFVGYLLSAAAIAVCVQAAAAGGLGQAFSRFFSKKIWWSRSAKADYLIATLNQAIMMGIAPRLLSQLALATLLFENLHVWFDGRPMLWSTAPAWGIAGLFTLTLFLLDDVTKYVLHRSLHKWPILWCFHKVHHSAETLTPFTVFRTHPAEGVLFALRATLVQACALSAFIFFFGDRVELASVFGANAFVFVFNIAGANLRHSHAAITYGRVLEHVFISPSQHQIHHSLDARHHDRNFGAVLAVWDWIGGSLYLAERQQELRFGVADGRPAGHDLKSIYLTPVADAFGCVRRFPAWRPFMIPIISKLQISLGHRFVRRAISAAIAVAVGATAFAVQAQELNIYSHRQPFLIEPFLNAYHDQTGTKINTVYASRGLAQRLLAEGERSPADVILTVDIARLYVYADKDLLAEVDSEVLHKNIPPHMRDPENRWFAFSKRARVIAVAKDVPATHAIKTYEDLTDPKWKGRICVRPGSHVYNRALVASFIDHKGMDAAEKWAKGLVANFARRPQANDRAQVKAVYEGVCDIAIINNYYYGKLKTSDNPDHRKWADAVQLIFPNQDGRGTHVNISGGGVAKYSKNKEEAVRFLEFLTSATAQRLYGEINFEYPVNPAVKTAAELKSWGDFKEDDMPISRIADLAPEAQRVIDRAGW